MSTVVLHLSSDDPTVSASSSASSFKIIFSRALQLSGDGYEVALQSAEFYHPGPQSSVYVSTSLNALVTTGSELTNTLAVLPSSEMPGRYFWEARSTIPLFIPVAQSSPHEIEIVLSDDSGEPIAVDPSIVTRLTLVIRRAAAAN